MPELPEVETVSIALSKVVINSKVKKVKILRKDLRWNIRENIEANLERDILKKPYRRGKYILIPTSKKNILLVHLGMSGQIRIKSNNNNLFKHDHFIINVETTENKDYSIIYNDPRRFGYIDFFNIKEIESHFLLKKLGAEPLSNEFTTDYLQKQINKRSKCIKNLLMDQSIVAGIGNIYASEILYRAKVNPLRSVDSLNQENLKNIVDSTKYILNKSINVGGTSIKNHLQPDGKLGYFVQKLQVYGKAKQKCKKCNHLIINTIINSRATYFCKICQK